MGSAVGARTGVAGVTWETRLGAVVGSRTANELGKHLELETVGDLLSHYPRTFVELGQVSSLGELREGELVSVVAQVVDVAVFPYRDRRTSRTAYRTELRARLGDGEIWATFFERAKRQADWRQESLRRGTTVVLSGKFGRNTYKQNRWELTHPEVDAEGDTTGDPAGDPAADPAGGGPPKRLRPIYPIAGKLQSSHVERAVGVVLDVVGEVPERIPPALRQEHGLIGAQQALHWMHRPTDWQQYGAATKRLRFDEAFVVQVVLAQRRHRQRDLPGAARTGRPGGLYDAFAERLPFELTAGQRQVEETILRDLAQEHPMHRLLQGEVGSGKTVVALRAMLRVVDSGGQAALLAPTEVLAQQHRRSVTTLLGDLAAGGMLGGAAEATRVALLTGSLPAAARRRALLEAASGEAGIVIGTHALIEDRVQFADLGLVVVDEQHRFGVEQRAALVEKTQAAGADGEPGGPTPHVLVMTATPIPRTVAMTVFGDLETSALTELPAGRSPIQTTVVPLGDQPGWLARVWARVREEVEGGRQAYVVCPRIAVGEPLPGGEGGPDPAAVEEVAPALAAGPLAGLRVSALHGRLPAEEKDDLMQAFAAGQVDVLVSTTVIEVGVDVGNATTMVVLDAERFGISQLHQLRGRVGRGGHPGLCLLLTHAEAGGPGRERLDAVAGTLDGFRLAELDLRSRKEGDVLGSRQSGARRTLRLLSVARDAEVIDAARAAATQVVEEDPELQGHPGLRAAVAALEERADTGFLDRA